MSTKLKAAAIGGSVLLVAAVAFFLLSNKDAGGLPGVSLFTDEPAVCPLTGEEPRKESLVERPAVAVKIENSSVAYPLSGLENADVVYEELVEGGVTRFMAVYHCGNTSKAGPVRSARMVDPAIMMPATKILAFSGANQIVLENLAEHEVVQVEENNSRGALQRVERVGVSFEHTLYANTSAVRRVGTKDFDDPPPSDMFQFGELEGRAKRAATITIDFSGATTITYTWDGKKWLRSQAGEPFVVESGRQIAVDNVIVESHKVNLSETIVDVAGNPSVDIADETGSGRAVLFRDGRAIEGTWEREDVDGAVVFLTRAGDEMVLKPGNVWIELVPSNKGEVKGSFSYAR